MRAQPAYQLGNFGTQEIPIHCGLEVETEYLQDRNRASDCKHHLRKNLTTMLRAGLQLPISLFLLLLATADSRAKEHCKPSSCGEIPIIKPPFRLTTDPESCGIPEFSLSCESNTTVLNLRSYGGSSFGRYYVKAIDYDNLTIRLVDDGVIEGNCSSLPTHPMLPMLPPRRFYYFNRFLRGRGPDGQQLIKGLALINCDNPVDNSTTTTPLVNVETSPCIDFGPNSSSSTSYAVVGSDLVLSDLPEMCRVEMTAMLPITSNYDYSSKVTFQEIHRQLEYGFQLEWYHGSVLHLQLCTLTLLNTCFSYLQHVTCKYIVNCKYILTAFIESGIIDIVALYHLLLRVLGTPVVVALLVYRWRRRHRSAYRSIEEFLRNQTNLVPIRYSYYHIKKITGGFKDKLGQGGFGSVYKAKLRGGGFAAVKMLGTTTNNNNKPSAAAARGGKGQDFMNEVATIGRIHHANVVRLIGYCSEGSKQALVYEFMANGSLDKHISQSHHKDGGGGGGGDDQRSTVTSCLSFEQLYHISLGVARGIEYLHRGCEMQILHFDIKPHNILLDENFTPKISDFGLARLNQAGRDNDIATLTAARGTIGYMAPELFYKNIGGVSNKADVYSFGMLLLEMAGKRRNSNSAATDQSTAYFPSWVHNQVSMPGTPIVVGEVTEEEEDIAKKMVIVGLWCIQTSPSNRPPMNKVVEMLEGNLDSLELPPKPVLYAREAVITNEEGSSSSFVSSEYTQSLIINQ
ncbi:unnamed protein product [Linum trigynum]|uniref:Protein kinase domain-containing protein n=1 Tax=Linum trigynum TaxID=586398 RepID=A0AAV2D2V7_9ROSI